MLTKFGLLSLTVFVWALSFSNCRTNRPNADSTPPTVKWAIQHRPGNWQEIVGDGSINQLPNESLNVLFIVIDPEGVHRIGLAGSSTITCMSGADRTGGISDEFPEVQTLNPDSAGQVLTRMFMFRAVGPFTPVCEPGYSFSSGSYTLHGTGENYFGGITRATLIINHLPPG